MEASERMSCNPSGSGTNVVMVDTGSETVAIDLDVANDAPAWMRYGHLSTEEVEELCRKYEEESKHLKSWEEAYRLSF